MLEKNYAAIAEELVKWHAVHQRDLPWRDAPAGTRPAYRVWISEIMLQQTRVETAVTYFNQWMARFPTVGALAAADLQDVLKAWEGLGYYARARNLHRSAQTIVGSNGGRLPDTRPALLALPGIGEYTAGAILSLAFNQAEPILDGNVKRVLARLADIDQPITERTVVRRLWELARVLVEAAPSHTAGACNEALMELGATICVPQNPRCFLCPLAAHCTAAAQGTQNVRPVMPPRKRTPHYDVTAGIIWKGEPYRSELLVAQRPPDGMLGGLWEFPGGKHEPQDSDLSACLRREIEEELAIQIDVGDIVTTVQHAYTHFRITLHAFHARHMAGEPQAIGCAAWQWVHLEDLDRYPFPVTDQKIIAALRAQAPR
ncbi:MAG: A/G-specific adenine glycosylase [Caldilineaceae bacterium]|nr:A/G-specific adenine glycosylase [Caldilineaceae bacterium]